jgi:hypothetical protein
VRRTVAVLLACLAIVAAAPAHAGRQLRADDEPTTEGPFYDPVTQCDDQTLKSDGKPVIKVAFCIFFYSFDTLSELDVSDEYGVVWAQATFDAFAGYCTTELSFYVEVSPGTSVYDRIPPKRIKTKRPVGGLFILEADAGGHAITPGTVSQSLQLLPGNLTPLPEDESRVGLAWKGRSPSKLAFVTGAEIGWEMLATPPQMRLGADTIKLTSGRGC